MKFNCRETGVIVGYFSSFSTATSGTFAYNACGTWPITLVDTRGGYLSIRYQTSSNTKNFGAELNRIAKGGTISWNSTELSLTGDLTESEFLAMTENDIYNVGLPMTTPWECVTFSELKSPLGTPLVIEISTSGLERNFLHKPFPEFPKLLLFIFSFSMSFEPGFQVFRN